MPVYFLRDVERVSDWKSGAGVYKPACAKTASAICLDRCQQWPRIILMNKRVPSCLFFANVASIYSHPHTFPSYGASLRTSINAKFHQMELVQEQALANTESRLGGTVAFFSAGEWFLGIVHFFE